MFTKQFPNYNLACCMYLLSHENMIIEVSEIHIYLSIYLSIIYLSIIIIYLSIHIHTHTGILFRHKKNEMKSCHLQQHGWT